MTHPGSDTPSPTDQAGPFAPAATGPVPPAQPGASAPARKTGAATWLPIAGSVVVAGVVGVGSLTGWFGAGAPAVGDCIQLTGATEFEVVDCDGSTAEYRIVGVEEEQQTYPDFMADESSCADFATTEVALWEGAETEEGSVYCAEAV